MQKQSYQIKSRNKSKLLLHTCCACCATEVHNRLKGDYELTLFWYNPNIYPKSEYKKRLSSFRKLANKLGCKYVIDDSYETDNAMWQKEITGLENEPEGGKRCARCYRFRLEQTVMRAKANGFDIFATTLTISPHKNASSINQIGKEVACRFSHPKLDSGSNEIPKQVQNDEIWDEIECLVADFKKQDGFKKSIELSRQHNLYRQSYCGCRYSIRNADSTE